MAERQSWSMCIFRWLFSCLLTAKQTLQKQDIQSWRVNHMQYSEFCVKMYSRSLLASCNHLAKLDKTKMFRPRCSVADGPL